MLGKVRRKLLSDLTTDESYQIRKFADSGLDWKQACHIADETVMKSGIPRTDPSNHYELFAGISQVCTPTSVLEVGTHRGVFTSFLAALWPNAKVVTYELPMRDSLPTQLAAEADLARHYVSHFESDANFRDSILSKFPNVELRLQDSTVLALTNETFDVAWIDGDHRYPVVAFDVLNAVRLCKSKSWIGVDDIRIRAQKSSNRAMGSTEGYETVCRIAGAGLADLNLVLKRGKNARIRQTLEEHKHIAVLRRS